MSTRRSFLKISAAACATSALPAELFAQVPSSNPFSAANLGPYAQGLLNKATFEALLQTVFTVFTPAGAAYMRLVTCQSLTANGIPATSSSAQRPLRTSHAQAAQATDSSGGFNFVLAFTVSGNQLLQGTYTVDHATLGRFALFLVPGGSPSAPTAAAVFNTDPGSFKPVNPGKSFESLLPPPPPARNNRSTGRSVFSPISVPGRAPVSLSLD